jgi:hypothetical protein
MRDARRQRAGRRIDPRPDGWLGSRVMRWLKISHALIFFFLRCNVTHPKTA